MHYALIILIMLWCYLDIKFTISHYRGRLEGVMLWWNNTYKSFQIQAQRTVTAPGGRLQSHHMGWSDADPSKDVPREMVGAMLTSFFIRQIGVWSSKDGEL